MDKLKIEDIAPETYGEKFLSSLSLSADSVLTAFNTIIDALSSTTPSPSPTPETYTAGNGLQLSGNQFSVNISEEKDNVLTTKSKKLYVSTLNRADRVADVMLPVTGINATMTGIASETGYGRAIAIGAMADGSRKVVVIYTSGNVYVSEDDGVTFTYTASIGDYARDLTFCSGYFYAVKKAKLWKASINDLATWTRLADVPSGDGRRLTTTSGNVIYVGCDSKIYTLKNDVLTEVTALTNLATYAEYPAGIVQEENGLLFAYTAYAQDTTKGLVIYESSDNGSTWTNVLLDTNNINGFAGITYFKGQYVAINSEITTQTGYYNDYVSQDGITWKLATWKRSTCGYSDQVIVSNNSDVLIVIVNAGAFETPADPQTTFCTRDLQTWYYLSLDDGSKVRSWRAVKLNDTGFISCGTDGDYNTIGTFFKSFSNVVVSDMASANEDLGDITDKLNMLIAIVKAMNVQKLF